MRLLRSVFIAAIAAVAFMPVTAPAIASTTEDLSTLEDVARQFQERSVQDGAVGFYVDDATGDVVVVVPESLGSTFRLTSTGVGGFRARVALIPYDETRLAEAKRRLRTLGRSVASGATGESIAFFFSPRAGQIEAHGSISTETVAGALGDLGDLVHYTEGISVVPASRASMTPPFEGAAQAKRVGSSSPWDCSTGFTVKKTTGVRYMVFAGHCGAYGSSWKSPGSGYSIGTVQWRQFEPRDLMLVGGQSYAPVIYTGGATGVESTVKGAADPVFNNPIYCYSGAMSLEHCDMNVLNFTADVCYEGGCYQDLMTFQRSGTSCPMQGGDSGGPFYLDFPFGGFPQIRGIVTAHTDPNVYCYGERWTSISTTFNVSIVTG